MSGKRQKDRFDLAFLSDFGHRSEIRAPRFEIDFHNADFKRKMALRQIIKQNFPSRFTETRLVGPNLESFGFALNYNYQRICLDLRGSTPNQFIYPSLAVRSYWTAKGWFTSSGQAAVSAVLTSYRNKSRHNLKIVSDLYWESIYFAEQAGWGISNKSKIGFLDSSMLVGSLAQALDRAMTCNELIVDTTCWGQSDPSLVTLLDWAQRHNKKLVLVRSCLKLDSLGMEYGRLGSVLWLSPKRKPFPSSLIQRFQNNLCYWGGYASTDQLYPFWMSRRFQKTNSRWIKNLQKSNRNFAKYFMRRPPPSPFFFREFQHGIFNWIMLPAIDPKRMEYIFRDLMRRLKQADFQAASVASYPWDFIALTYFKPRLPYSDPADSKAAIRFCLPPYKDFEIARVSQIVESWMNDAKIQL